MKTDHTIEERSPLRFPEEVKAHFSFLESKGFQCTHSETTLVRFYSSKLSIVIYYGRQSYEIGLRIEEGRGSVSYSFSEVLRLFQSGRSEHYRDYAAHTVEGVAKGVQRLSELFLKCIDAGILDDTELFSRLKQQRDEWAQNYAFETELEQIRRKFEPAWAKKNFSKVVELLAPFQEHLNSSELKKLEYAKKHLSGHRPG